MTEKKRLSAERIALYLDEYLEVEFSFYNTELATQSIDTLDWKRQEFVLDWVRRVSATNIEIGYQFACNAKDALEKAEYSIIEAWLLHAMDTYDRSGLRAAIEVMQDMEGFISYGNERIAGALFEDSETILSHFVQGLSGRRLKLREAGQALPYGDSETLFLPHIIARFPSPEDNFKLYKAMVAHLWAQVRYGTFRLDIAEVIQGYPDLGRALHCFHMLERIRLDACLKRELPGLYRDMCHLSGLLGEESVELPQRLVLQLEDSSASVDDSRQFLAEVYAQFEPTQFCYQGCLRPELVTVVRAKRVEKEKAMIRVLLGDLEKEHKKPATPERETRERQFDVEIVEDQAHQLSFEITLDGEPVAPPEEVNELLSSVMLDFSEIPEEYLVPAGAGEYDISLYQDQQLKPEDVWSGTYHEEGAYLYNEWDFRRKHYKKNWCVLRELEVDHDDLDFYRHTLDKYRGHILSLRRTFELLRGEDKRLRRQTDGEDVDIDALVEAYADLVAGREMTNRLFTRMQREDRSIAVIFMVDMSGSTRGWINDAEREALILMAESLQILGDQYAIYGFSGWARKRCDAYRIKEFDEPLNDDVKARICGIKAKDYTRMGAPIRHLSKKLNEVDARIKLLITLSDGKPDDYDLEYRGNYAIEDTRMALYEAHRDGVHSYCITIDREGNDYLPHMYGAANYTVIEDVSLLPLKIADIYRKVAT